MLYREILKFETKPDRHIDITANINEIAGKCRISDGICHIFLQGTTAGLLLNENCEMLLGDFQNLFEKLTPKDKIYQHPDNAFSHMRASMISNELTIPVANNKLLLGQWQKIMLMEFDTQPRTRNIIVTILC
jgi:secondary thiamine-phosphate synthase enzyme